MKRTIFPRRLQDISRHRQFLYGFAALWIIFFHMKVKVPTKGIFLPLGFFQATGGCGVEIFLMLTGLGLYASMQKNPDIKGFYGRRFMRVFLPSFIITAISALAGKRSLMGYLGSISLLGYWAGASAPWYVAFILTMYLVYPLILYVQKKKPAVLWAGIALAVLLDGVIEFSPLGLPNEILLPLSRVPVFLLGCALAPLVHENRRIPRWVLPVSVVSTIVLIAVASQVDVLRNSYFFCCTLIYIPYSIIVLMVLSTLANLFSCGGLRNVVYRWVALCGLISLELYLCHVPMRGMLEKLSDFGATAGGRLKLEIAAVICTFIISIALRSLTDSIMNLYRSVRIPDPEGD